MTSISIPSSMAGMMPPPPSSSITSLTDEQSEILTETLSQYDAENLTTEDATAIVEALTDAGIEASEALASQMEELGFDARAIGDAAAMDNPPPPPPPEQVATLNVTEDMLSELNELLNAMADGDLSEDEEANTLSRIKQIFEEGMPEGGLVDITV